MNQTEPDLIGKPLRQFRLCQLSVRSILPMDFRSWLAVMWGFDIFVGKVPFLKTIVLGNIIMWVLMWGLK